MSEQTLTTNHERTRTKVINQGAGQAVYGLGFIGAAVYFIQHATTFGMGVLGLLKAMVWPAFVVYKALEMLKL